MDEIRDPDMGDTKPSSWSRWRVQACLILAGTGVTVLYMTGSPTAAVSVTTALGWSLR